jgi:predicted AAA+ superfamily ATPase
MIPRLAAKTVHRLAKGFPIVALTGPRQSGKTTLARSLFAHKPYVSLENPDELAFATSDPKRFLAQFAQGAVLDEVQRCPSLLSWLQGVVDERRQMGDFVLTGSAQFDLVAGITQSLAGRAGRVELLPLSMHELHHAGMAPASLEDALFQGGYPALYDRPLAPHDWFANYMATYVERDVRQVLGVRDLAQFHTFVRMCAARTGQLLNLAALGADCGISAVTARHWLSVLESSYIVTLLRPHHRNFGKRLVKTPKLYFVDVGLAAWLMGIRDAATLQTHAARGALFETWVVSELIKQRLNQGAPADLHFWRDSTGTEVDVLLESPMGLTPVEIKSGSTWAADWTQGLNKWRQYAAKDPQAAMPAQVIYGGNTTQERDGLKLWSWRDAHLWAG